MSIISKLVADFVIPGRAVDYNGTKVNPEVKVAIASVRVTAVSEKNNGNLSVNFEADGAKFGLNGFINSDEPAAAIIKLAHEKGEVICVRFEKKRKKNIDPNLPMSEIAATMDIARQNIVKLITGVFDFNSGKWVLINNSPSDPSNDPEGTIDSIKSLDFSADGFFDKAQGSNGDPAPAGYVNPNKEIESKENALMTIYYFIREQEKEHGYELTEEQRHILATKLTKMANHIQIAMFGLETPSYRAYSHTRARFAIFKYAEVVSPLNLEAVKAFNVWGPQCLKSSIDTWNWSREASKTL